MQLIIDYFSIIYDQKWKFILEIMKRIMENWFRLGNSFRNFTLWHSIMNFQNGITSFSVKIKISSTCRKAFSWLFDSKRVLFLNKKWNAFDCCWNALQYIKRMTAFATRISNRKEGGEAKGERGNDNKQERRSTEANPLDRERIGKLQNCIWIEERLVWQGRYADVQDLFHL